MLFELKRTYNNERYCIGHLYANGLYVCDTIEDTDRGLTQDMSESEIAERKVKAKTAIPTGTYYVTTAIISPKFWQKRYYSRFCGGKMPRLLCVPGYDGILIHRGINETSTAGCIIVGYNTIKGMVTQSQQAFEKVYKMIDKHKDDVWLKITRSY